MWLLAMQEAAGKEDEVFPAERNPAAVKYTGNLVSCRGLSRQSIVLAVQTRS